MIHDDKRCAYMFAPGVRCQREKGHEGSHVWNSADAMHEIREKAKTIDARKGERL